MTRKFDNIASADCRAFLTGQLTDPALLGKDGYLMRHNLYVLPYKPAQEAFAKDLIRALVEDELPRHDVKAANINLYDMVLAYLDEQDLWEPLCEAEGDNSRDELIMMLQDTIGVADVLKPTVEQAIEDTKCDIAFITGVGETFPYIRTHALLSELDVSIPVVLVFPGEYKQLSDGTTSLDILNIPSGANGGYYRVTNVFDL